MQKTPGPTQTILITGCSSGIGQCLALGLKARGHRVFASVRQARDVAPLASLGLESLQLDLADSDSIAQALDAVFARTGGRLDVLINNGAYGQPGAVEDLSRAALRAQFETNLFGTHELTTRVLPAMRAQGHGRVIQISSVLGIVSLAYRGAYNASKHALEALSDTLRLELRGSGIYISLIEPGPITSRFRENAFAAYKAYIDPSHSAHRAHYAAVERRLGGGKPLPFTLPPEAVLAKVEKALNAARPRERYAVTFPTYLFAIAKRLLTSRALDRFLFGVTSNQR